MTTLHLMVGLPCAGKTTAAKAIEKEISALRLTPDEWHLRLFGQDTLHPDHDKRHSTVEDIMWDVAAKALQNSMDVILDFGFWGRSERDDYRARAAALNAGTVVHFLDVSKEELLARLKIRNEQPGASFHIPPNLLVEWFEIFQSPTKEEMALNCSGMT